MDLDRSIFNLLKTNGGFFKSEKQSDFIRKMADETFNGTWQWTSATAWGNSALYIAHFDEKGVTLITKESLTTHKVVNYFERKMSHSEWHKQHDARGRLRDEMHHIYELTAKYRKMYDERNWSEYMEKQVNSQYWPRFMINASKAVGNMNKRLFEQLMPDMTEEECKPLIEQYKANNERLQKFFHKMAKSARAYDKIHDDLWEVRNEYDKGNIKVALIDEIEL